MKKAFLKEEVMKELEQLGVTSIILDGYYTEESEDDLQLHTPVTQIIFENALKQNDEAIFFTDEDYLAQVFVEDNELKVEIARHNLEEFENGIEYREFEFKNEITSEIYEKEGN